MGVLLAAMSGLALDVVPSVDALGPEWDEVFAAGPGVQTGRAWLAASAEAALPEGARPRFVAVAGPDGPVGLFSMVEGPGVRWESLTTPYTCLYQPLLRTVPQAEAACLAFGQLCRRWAVTRLEALDPAWPGLEAVVGGLRAAGLAVRRFDHFVNWYGDVPASGWEGYLAARPGELRETIRRKRRAAEREGVRIEIVRDAAALPAALVAYEAVYAKSWKEPEPFPRFNAALVAGLARTGRLRMFLMWRGETPIAAQYWTVAGGEATVLKLAHDEHAKPLSPGTVLTAAALKELIETEGVRSIDFGRGDDPYKRGWTGSQRMRIGLLAVDPRRFAGLAPLARHEAGQTLKAFRRFGRKVAGINRFLRILGDTGHDRGPPRR